jgi:UDP-glucose 6-dehydrogenase
MIFFPEFLIEGKSLYDYLQSSRIILVDNSYSATTFAILLKDSNL